MIFPNDNMSPNSKPWAREITKQLSNVIDARESDQINNTARDNQLNSSIIAVAALAESAQNTADAVTAIVDNIYTTGTTELDGAILAPGTITANAIAANTITGNKIAAGTITATQISSSYIYAGTINASQITAGTITGITLQTAASGRRVVISGTSSTYYDSSGSVSGTITAPGSGQIIMQSSSGAYVLVYSGGADIYGDGNNQISLINNEINFYTSQVVGTVPSSWQTKEGAWFGRGAFVASNVAANAASFSRTNAGDVVIFYKGSTTSVGSISVTTSATAYNTSSDYRLKENVVPLTNALARISQLKPKRFNFKVEPDRIVDGFIAHEAQEVVPEAVKGVKDEINEDGTPAYQGIDHSKIVPLLVAAVQELTEKVRILEGK